MKQAKQRSWRAPHQQSQQSQQSQQDLRKLLDTLVAMGDAPITDLPWDYDEDDTQKE
jgi:hypothetical protein